MKVLSIAKRNAPWQIVNGVAFMALLVGGWLYYPLGYFLVFCMVMAMGIGLFKGRNWCDWMCPRGSFWDKYLNRMSREVKVPKVFRSLPFRLFWLGVLMTMLTVNLIPVWGDFYLMGRPFVLILTVTTVVGLILGVIYHQRIWCMFCPMGTMANWLGKGKKPLQVTSDCILCGSCEKVCRMQIYPGTFRDTGVVEHGDCLKCSYCVEVCPKQALSFYKKAA
ncbi:MAG: 4Fe-4S binding protein [Thermodesulfobacteriota bacterium]